jgi:serine protease Do
MRTLILLVLLSGCLATGRMTPADIYTRTAASTVLVTTSTGSGSGTVILNRSHRAYVLTAFHVVDGARKIHLRVPTEDHGVIGRLEVAAEVLEVDRAQDLALLGSRAPLAVPALPVAHDEPALYDDVFIVASPLGLYGTATPGVLSAKMLLEHEGPLWELTGLIFFGSSGGTVVNARAELVAVPVIVATWNNLPVSQIGFAVPLGSIRTFLDRAVERGALDL